MMGVALAQFLHHPPLRGTRAATFAKPSRWRGGVHNIYESK